MTQKPRREWVALLVWVLVAGALRFAMLDRWSLWGDEAHTLSDTLDLKSGNLRSSVRFYPVLYRLELVALWILGPVFSIEFALRAVTAAAGTLAIGALFWCSRPLLDRHQRHCLAFLATFSPWLLYHAQFARAYAPLLLLSTLAALFFLRAMRSGKRWEMVVAVLCIFTGGFTHPTCWSLFAGLLASALVAARYGSPLRLRMMLYPLLVVLGFVVVLAFVFEDFVSIVEWTVLRDELGADSVFDLAQGVVYNFGLAPSVLAGLGLLQLWRDDRRLAMEIFVAVGLVAAVVFGLAAMGRAVEQRYLIPVVPLMLIAAAVQLSALARLLKDRVPAGKLVIPVLAILPFVPGLISNYADGNRHDIRGAAEYVRQHFEDGDAVVSENNFLMGWYMPELPEERLVEAPPQFGNPEGIPKLRSLEAELEQSGGRFWVVVPTYYLDRGGDETEFFHWVAHEGLLQHELYHRRIDYHQNRLQVYLVDPSKAGRWIPVEGSDED